MSLGGPCECCGGPTNWTIHRGEMLVRCVDGCLPLFEVIVPPPVSDLGAEAWQEFFGTLVVEEGKIL